MSQLTIESAAFGGNGYPFQYDEETEKIIIFLGERSQNMNLPFVDGFKRWRFYESQLETENWLRYIRFGGDNLLC